MLATAAAAGRPWDMVVVGGGAVGVGVALDAAARGYAVLLLERHDFGKGTSGRSTKLIHGGVRYLSRGEIGLVRGSLRERARLRANAPHVVRELAFVVPTHSAWESAYFGAGLKAYDLLAGSDRFGWSRSLNRNETARRLPNLKAAGLHGGVLYYDGQFDDARLLINLVRTAVDLGAAALNHIEAVGLERDRGGRIGAVLARDGESRREYRFPARAVINAGGPFGDAVRRLADPAAAGLIAPSRGSHIVVERAFLPGDCALLIPRTPDGRVLFAIPWSGRTLIGTTDVPADNAPTEPRPSAQEIDFLLDTAGRCLERAPTRADILCAFAGIRPLLRGDGAGGAGTAALSRDHAIHVDESGLITVAGGKWTTYRQMAQDCVDQAARAAGLPTRRCATATLPIHGASDTTAISTGAAADALSIYGSDAAEIRRLAADPALAAPLHPDLPYTGAEVLWAVRSELARTVEDVLARRTRALFLNARAAGEAAGRTAELMADELKRDPAWRAAQVLEFQELAAGYRG